MRKLYMEFKTQKSPKLFIARTAASKAPPRNCSHPSNAPTPIVVRFGGKCVSASDAKPKNADATDATDVTDATDATDATDTTFVTDVALM